MRFFAALIVISDIMNQGNTDMTMEMAEASYPVVSVDYDGYRLNQMHGYTEAMEVSQMRESITPLAPGRRISLEINTYGSVVRGIGFEVRSLDGGRLVENTQIEDFEQDGDLIPVSFGLKDLIDVNQEYMLVLLLTLESGKEVRYYTRVVSTDEYHVEDKLNYVDDFSRKTFDKEAARSLTKYMESNADGDNSSFGKVDIHSSFKQVTWGDLEVRRQGEPRITIKELARQTGSFLVEYYVSVPEGKTENYYRIKEYYRVRYTSDRMYLLDYERNMDQLFDASGNVYSNNKIMLGIVSGEIPMEESEGGNSLAFITGNRIYSYNVTDNKMALLFGFYDQDNLDARTMYDDHRIKILNVGEGEM